MGFFCACMDADLIRSDGVVWIMRLMAISNAMQRYFILFLLHLNSMDTLLHYDDGKKAFEGIMNKLELYRAVRKRFAHRNNRMRESFGKHTHKLLCDDYLSKQHFLYFLPDPHEHGSFRPCLSSWRACCTVAFSLELLNALPPFSGPEIMLS